MDKSGKLMPERRKSHLKILLAAPRGFCAGVVRAVEIVERALERYGAPVYVRHEIVHNRHVVEALERKGAVFVEELGEVPSGDRPVILSAHGAAKSVHDTARRRNLFSLDATCPLVSKVHREAEKLFQRGYEIILIGHEGHPEVIGTMGQLPVHAMSLIETERDAESFYPRSPEKLAYITQTTLSVDDTAAIVARLKHRFPAIVGPRKADICYATANRQEAVKAIASRCDMVLVIGAPNSSNSRRLVEAATRHGCKRARLIGGADDIARLELKGVVTLGVTASASAPEILVDGVTDRLREDFAVTIETVSARREAVEFNLPRELRHGRAQSA
ncbi:MAG: 4-hydroxy-3-methylbut-2-enyl diphosphate reductase [Hyphomicrobiales bacterium]